jgi:molybdate transport system substrate-binding protein
MNRRSTLLALFAAAAVLPAAAQTNPIHVLASNGVRAVILELKPECERTIGHPLVFQFGSTTDLLKKIDAGEPFDLAILTTEAINHLVKAGKVSSKVEPIARCGVGVGIRAGTPKPDIATPAAMKAALLQAKFITYAEDGASRVFVEQMEQKFGIADQMKSKTVFAHGSVAAAANVVAGKADMLLTLQSEILPIQGMELVGPLPASVQAYIHFAAASAGSTPNAEAAKMIIRFLKSPAAAPVYKAKGMEVQ